MDLRLLGHPGGFAERRNQLGRAHDELSGVTYALSTVVAVPPSRHRLTLQQELAPRPSCAFSRAIGFRFRASCDLVRKIKSNFFVSLDGDVEVPDKWHFWYFDDEMGAAVSAGFATADAMLMGRVLYSEWWTYWPAHADEPFGDVMHSLKKYVISNRLRAAEWQDTELISGDAAIKLTGIKAQDGDDRSALSARRADRSPRPTELNDVQDRRAEPQLRPANG